MSTFVGFVGELGYRLSDAQRVVCLVAFDGLEPCELDADDREIARSVFGDVDRIGPAARGVLVAVCGARGGKSLILCALYSLWRAVTADLSTLAPEERASAMIIAPDLQLAQQTLRFVAGAISMHPALKMLLVGETNDRVVIKRPDGHRVAIEIRAATAGGGAARGRSLVSAVLDECAFFHDASYKVNDEDVFRAVSPRVLPGGMVVLASTPWAEAGLLYTEYRTNFGSPKTAIAIHAPTLTMLDTERNRLVVARERQRDPDNAARDFDAMFMTLGSGLFFDPRALERALSNELMPLQERPLPCAATIAGDLGLVQDAAAFVVMHSRVEGEGFRYRVAEMSEHKPREGTPLKLSFLMQEGSAMARRHGRDQMYLDQYALEPAREHVPEGFMLELSNDSNADMYTTVRNLINEGAVEIPRQYEGLVSQLRLVMSRPKPGGGLSIVLPRKPGSHCDLASAFVRALYEANQNARYPDVQAGASAPREASDLGGF